MDHLANACARTLVAAALTIAGAPAVVRAQDPAPVEPPIEPAPVDEEPASPDEVRLVDGGFVLGDIVEVVEGERVVIDVRGSGERRTISWDQVAEVKRRGSSRAPIELEPIVDAPPPELEPTVGAPRVHVETPNGKTVLLYRSFGSSSNSNTVFGKFECKNPCDKVVDGREGSFFFFGGEKLSPSRSFTLIDKQGDVNVLVKPGRRGAYVTGFLLLTLSASFVLGGAIMAAVGHTVHSKTQYVGYGLLGGGLAMIAAGIPLLVLGRTRVKFGARKRASRNATW
jgi:hypothetical protein